MLFLNRVSLFYRMDLPAGVSGSGCSRHVEQGARHHRRWHLRCLRVPRSSEGKFQSMSHEATFLGNITPFLHEGQTYSTMDMAIMKFCLSANGVDNFNPRFSLRGVQFTCFVNFKACKLPCCIRIQSTSIQYSLFGTIGSLTICTAS